jgi:hypothetical protein
LIEKLCDHDDSCDNYDNDDDDFDHCNEIDDNNDNDNDDIDHYREISGPFSGSSSLGRPSYYHFSNRSFKVPFPP